MSASATQGGHNKAMLFQESMPVRPKVTVMVAIASDEPMRSFTHVMSCDINIDRTDQSTPKHHEKNIHVENIRVARGGVRFIDFAS